MTYFPPSARPSIGSFVTLGRCADDDGTAADGTGTSGPSSVTAPWMSSGPAGGAGRMSAGRAGGADR